MKKFKYSVSIVKKIFIGISFFSISNVFASHITDPVFDKSNNLVVFCKPYKIFFHSKGQSSNKFLSYSTWCLNRYDYLVKGDESNAAIVVFEPKGFICKNNELLMEEDADNEPLISNYDLLQKMTKLKIKFQKLNDDDDYKYLKVSYLGYYYLSYNADLISLNELNGKLRCSDNSNPSWCYQGKSSDEKIPIFENIAFIPL